MALSEARKKANRKWNENNLDRLYVTVKAGEKAKIQSAADLAGVSVNKFIVDAVKAKMRQSP
jgi:uncharacterized protein (DUF1778 family)